MNQIMSIKPCNWARKRKWTFHPNGQTKKETFQWQLPLMVNFSKGKNTFLSTIVRSSVPKLITHLHELCPRNWLGMFPWFWLLNFLHLLCGHICNKTNSSDWTNFQQQVKPYAENSIIKSITGYNIISYVKNHKSDA